jgi:hypothetical protein
MTIVFLIATDFTFIALNYFPDRVTFCSSRYDPATDYHHLKSSSREWILTYSKIVAYEFVATANLKSNTLTQCNPIRAADPQGEPLPQL